MSENGRPTYDEVLAANSLDAIHTTLRRLADMPPGIEYIPSIPPEILPFSLAATEAVKVADPDCILMIFSTPGDGITLEHFQRDGTVHYLYIEEEYIGVHDWPKKKWPTPLFWHRTQQ